MNNLYKITDPQTAQEFRECYGFVVKSASEVFVSPGLNKFGSRRIEAEVGGALCVERASWKAASQLASSG